MAAIFSFKCSQCGQIHEGSPSFAFKAPAPFYEQSMEVQQSGQLGEDLCTYEDESGSHYFIRVCLEIPIHGVADPFLWGVWVSLSEDSYNHYIETYDHPDPEISYFGWFCNYLPYYNDTYALKTRVHPREQGIRPLIALEPGNNELQMDFHQGISPEKAVQIAEIALHR